MKKIPTIFERDQKNRALVTSERNPECAWVFDGEGVATRKYDGSCCMIRDGILYKRRQVKPGYPNPPGFIEVERDDKTLRAFGWVEVDMESGQDRWHREAFRPGLADGTYELLGPRVNGNPEKRKEHMLQSHVLAQVLYAPRTFGELREWFRGRMVEGVVWHHEDGRMAKIKKKDFGMGRDD